MAHHFFAQQKREDFRPLFFSSVRLVVLLVLHNGVDLLAGALIVHVGARQIGFDQLFGQHVAGDLAAQGDNVAVVGQAACCSGIPYLFPDS